MLREYQQSAVDSVLAWFRYKTTPAIVNMPTGSGKCFRAGTAIMMADGTTMSVEDIKKGMRVMGVGGSSLIVGNTCAGTEEMYEIRPKKGESYFVNKSHILSLKKTRERKTNRYNGKAAINETLLHNIVNISVEDYLVKTKHFKHLHKGWRSAVDFGITDNFLIPPYLLGVWLGDGSSNSFAVTTGDQEIKDYLRKFAESVGLRYSEYDKRIGCVRASITSFLHKERKNTPFPKELRRLKILNNKHVPHIYKTASREARLDILAGIIDTDGHLSNGTYDICLVNERLIDDIIFIARSLGFSAYKKECKKTCTNNGVTGTYFRTSICGDVREIPCKIPHKIALPRRQIKDHLVFGFDVFPVGVEKYYGFEIVGDNKLFLLGDFTVTHNSHVISSLIAHYYHEGKRVLLLAHRKELLTQTGSKLSVPAGYYSASLGEKELEQQVTIAGIQSIYNKELQPLDVIIVDECHMLPNGADGQYWTLINKHPQAKLIGLSATPFRLKGGKLGWGEEVYKIGYQPLLDQGFLSPLSNKLISDATPDLSAIDVRLGEYVENQLATVMEDPELIDAAVRAIIAYSHNRHSCLIFCVSVNHARLIVDVLNHTGVPAHLITGETNQDVRDEIIEQFKDEFGQVRYIVNVNVLSVGFDAPNVDMIVCLRPTKSKALWEQMCGRGVRIAEGKRNCLLVDMAGNLDEHGALGRPYREKVKGEAKGGGKICPECEEYVKPAARECPDCGYQWPEPERPKVAHEYEANQQSRTVHSDVVTYDVFWVKYKHHLSKKGNDTLMVNYGCEHGKYRNIAEWIMKSRVKSFMAARGHILESNIDDCSWDDIVWHAEQCKAPKQITVDHSKEFPRIIQHHFEQPELEDVIPW